MRRLEGDRKDAGVEAFLEAELEAAHDELGGIAGDGAVAGVVPEFVVVAALPAVLVRHAVHDGRAAVGNHVMQGVDERAAVGKADLELFRGILENRDHGDLEGDVVSLQEIGDAAQVDRVVVDAHVFDADQRPLAGGVLDLEDVVQQVAERQVMAALVGVGEGAVGEIPEAAVVQDVGVGSAGLRHGRGQHLGVPFVRYRDDAQVRLVLGQEGVLIHHAGHAEVAVIFLPGEAELALSFGRVDQAFDVLAEPGEGLLVGAHVGQETVGNGRVGGDADIETGVVALQHAGLILARGNDLAGEAEVTEKIVDEEGVDVAFGLVIRGAVVDDGDGLLRGGLSEGGKRAEQEQDEG